jgi:hypothetical protein
MHRASADRHGVAHKSIQGVLIMLKKIQAVSAMLLALATSAAVEANY